MNKDKAKEIISNYKGKLINFKYNGSRNQNEEFEGYIENIYNAVFTIKTKEKEVIKTFSYNDVINKSLQIFI